MRGAQRVAQPLRATKEWLESFPFDDCAIIRRFCLSAAGLGNVLFRIACTIDSLLSASVGSPEVRDAGSGAVGI